MANITMWATKSSSYTDAMVAGKPTSYTTSETTIISSEDAAKIRKDAEDAIRNDEKKNYYMILMALSMVGQKAILFI